MQAINIFMIVREGVRNGKNIYMEEQLYINISEKTLAKCSESKS